MTTSLNRRAGPLFGAVMVLVGLLAAVSPAIPAVSALDPTPDPAATIAPDPSAAASADPSAAPSPTADPVATPAPTAQPATGGLSVAHYWVGSAGKSSTVYDPGKLDEPRLGLQPAKLYLVRFAIVNSSGLDVVVAPSLLVGGGLNAAAFAPVPPLKPVPGAPFYAANDEGHVFRTRTTAITTTDLRLTSSADAAASPVDGLYSGGVNPLDAMTLPAHTYTELEFGVRATVDSVYLASYLFRLDLGTAVVASLDAQVSLGAEPLPDIPADQSAGVLQGAPLPLYKLLQPTPILPAVPGRIGGKGPSGAVTLNAPVYSTPHMMYSLTDDSCAACHTTHSASGVALLESPYTPISGLCFRCHNGTGANSNVQAQYTSGSLPANNAATASYYSHPAISPSTHRLDSPTEFAGVLNRHSECTDCHQPHNADATTGSQSTTGWTAGGPIKGAGGVAVTNGAADTAPTYALAQPVTYEYQLCFKCHSGYTQLLAQDPAHPSYWALDKAIEFNPANLAFHPVEGKGKNPNFIRTGQTVGIMDQNLAGTSTYKIWTFTSNSTIRCENCHGSSGQTQVPANAGAASDNHASLNRGLLLQPYRDRLLKPTGQAYAEGDYALCFTCHTNRPFTTASFTAQATSQFRYHGYHIRGIASTGDYLGGNIDTDGAGAGNALCAECHFRIHGSSFPANGSTPNPRLVNFAPDVQPFNGVLSMTPRVGNTPGTCTLLCHTKEHDNLQY